MEKIRREESWLAVKGNNAYVKAYIRTDFKSAYVRFLDDVKLDGSYRQYFQIAYINDVGEHLFRSFRVYSDDEEKRIREALPGIPSHLKNNF